MHYTRKDLQGIFKKQVRDRFQTQILLIKQGYVLNNWVEGISGSQQKKNRLKLVSPTFTTEQKNVLIYWLKLTCEFYQIIEKKQKLI